MTGGPQFAKLEQALSGAAEEAIDRAAAEWARCTQILTQISRALVSASPQVKEQIGGQTGPAVDAAFHRSSQGMVAKAHELTQGSEALSNAAVVIREARKERDRLAASAPTPPGPYTPPVGQPTEADIQAKAQHQAAEDRYAATMADHETRAQKQNEQMDTVFRRSTAVMQEIHGEKPPASSTDSQGGGGGAGGGGTSTPLHHATAPGSGGATSQPDPTWVPHHHQTPTTTHGDPGSPGGPGGTVAAPGTGAAQGGATIDHPGSPGTGGLPGGLPAASTTTGGGLSATAGLGVAGAAAGGVGGGLLGAGLAAGGIRGGLTPIVTTPGTAAGGVRGIGTTARTGVSGALGRSGAAAVGTGGRGTAARTGASASRSGSAGRGSRGAAGRRGAAGSTSGGRGGRSRDGRKGREDLFDASEDWVDDEDAAPGVLD